MKIKPNRIGALMSMGIGRKNAKAITGQPCSLTGRTGQGWAQVEFNGKLLGRAVPFVFCVPETTIQF